MAAGPGLELASTATVVVVVVVVVVVTRLNVSWQEISPSCVFAVEIVRRTWRYRSVVASRKAPSRDVVALNHPSHNRLLIFTHTVYRPIHHFITVVAAFATR